jgi:NAD(P) transhydrogenase subunit alpha
MRIGVPRETAPGERRVAVAPDVVSRLTGSGFEIVVEAGAGEQAAFPDSDFAEAGATIAGSVLGEAEGIVKVRKPSVEEAGKLREGDLLIGFLEPLTDTEGISRLTDAGVVAFAMESIPRITRAPPMDALTSQARISHASSRC